MNAKRAFWTALVVTLALGAHARAEMIQNGDFEDTWTGTLAPHWTETLWSDMQPSTSPSVIAGTYSAEIFNGTTSQNVAETQYDFTFKMDFAVFDLPSGDRTMHVSLENSSSSSLITMRVTAGNVLQIYGGGSWNNVGSLVANATTDAGTTGEWGDETPVVNSLEIVARFSDPTPTYDVTLNDTTVSNLTYSHQDPLTDGVAEVSLHGASSDSNWLADNVSMVPEPTTMGLLGAGAIGLLVRRKRNI